MPGFSGLASELTKMAGGVEVKLRTLQNGVKVDVPGQFLYFDHSRKIASRVRRSHLPPEILEEISYGAIEEIVKTIGLYNMHDGSYASIKSSSTFQAFYGYAKRSVSYLEGGAVVSKLVDTFPCRRCGIILPQELMTVDHQKPQAGGQLLAILKVLRAFGFTEGRPKGAKGGTLRSMRSHNEHWQFAMQATPKILPPPSVPIDEDSKAARQTLNDQGAMIFTALSSFGADEEVLKKQCMHSLINLKPMCQSCNSSKGNQTV
ncbi:hypothetical protein [Duganella sp. HH105]|uniref:hypothetical protein n=1 Tax=Duganella sp. HH105 TaxID=1781067 RepID=UPI0008939859|nr:hypothetical protein [Duganella sp. HH105]OEZ55478.1 hypothetical protein DUGA6_53900 [Duganella sp. HH105]